MATGPLSCAELDGERLWVALQVDRTTVAIDDSVLVSVAVSNASGRAITTHDPLAYGDCLPGFVVIDAGGQVVTTHPSCTEIPEPTLTLAPGEALVFTGWWIPGRSTLNGQPIQAALYRLQAAVRSDSRVVRTGAFDIVVTEPDAP